MSALFFQIIGRDVKLSWRQGSTGLMVVFFFAIVVSLFPFAVGPDPDMLSRISVAVIWVAVLLSSLLSLDRIFQADFEDGSLDQFVLLPLPLELVVLAKSLAHWLTTALPLIILSPVLGIMMHLPANGYLPMMVVMVLASPTLSFVGAVGAALTVNLRRGGVLLSLLVLPLYIPSLIFSVLAVNGALDGQDIRLPLMILAGFTLGSAVLAPWAAAAAIRSGLD
ncbi:heme exporter protein CcmB [Emcibacter nanhaiensis]|uniref:Heme exporter protein B n=1 Tax=Emcibacter nanhaiensis TaxID=1505037 RepID=A0A501PM41_9PROT|nr:heme exporter protein CcmB [Emcibacter nanhaiensis]TPD61569.1 heme exporter protein CcmB [Emcibacter nanhaiensis]